MLSGCSEKSGETGSLSLKYAASVIYDGGAPEAPEGSLDEELLNNVLIAEVSYFCGKEARLTDGTVMQSLTVLKKRFAAAITDENFDRSQFPDAGEAADSLFVTYQTDPELRTSYDAVFDNYDPDDFAAHTYGIDAESYYAVYYEQSVVNAYLAFQARKAADEASDEEVREFYEDHKDEYRYAVAVVILTASDPEDEGEALLRAEEIASEINSGSDRMKAVEDALMNYSALPGWAEESGMLLLRSGAEYAGLSGEILKNIVKYSGKAYSAVYGSNVFVIYLEDKSNFADGMAWSEIAVAVREDLAASKALSFVPDTGLTISQKR